MIECNFGKYIILLHKDESNKDIFAVRYDKQIYRIDLEAIIDTYVNAYNTKPNDRIKR